MKILHLPSSTPYQLHPDSQLAVERTNPFFHDYAEQTAPLDIPASDHNRRLLGYPDLLGQPMRQATIEAQVSDGEYHATCRQAVLSAQRKGNIATTFYINDGALYSQIQQTRLRDILAADTITFQGNTLQQRVAAAIDECRRIRLGTSAYSDRLAIFPILVTDDSDDEESTRKYKAVNLIDTATGDFEGAVARTETVRGKAVNLAPGYYITPFVKTAYVLGRLFAHYGYTLQPSLITHEAPFNDMVLLNNVIDTLANGYIRLSDIVPDITVSDTLALFRKKFRCEFAADEQARTVSVVFLKDMAGAQPAADLTPCLIEEPTIQYKTAKDYKRTVLKPKATVPEDPDTTADMLGSQAATLAPSADTFDSLGALAQAHPAAFLHGATGTFLCPAVCAKDNYTHRFIAYIKVAEASLPYDTGEEGEGETIEIPECLPAMRSLFGAFYLYPLQNRLWGDAAGDRSKHGYIHPYVGDYTTANSVINIPGEGEATTTKKTTMQAMLCLSFIRDGRSIGTITPYDPNSSLKNPTRLADYALHYHGEDGIFERFHRDNDTLLRNALDTVKMRLLLPQHLKQTLPATAKVTVRGTALLIDRLKFTLGGKDAPQECDLRTLLPDNASNPNVAPTLGDLLPQTLWRYRWKLVEETTPCTEAEYNAREQANVGNEETPNHLLPLPTADMVGQSHYLWHYYYDDPRNFSTGYGHQIVYLTVEAL